MTKRSDLVKELVKETQSLSQQLHNTAVPVTLMLADVVTNAKIEVLYRVITRISEIISLD